MATLPLQLRCPQQSWGEPCIVPRLASPGAAPPEQPPRSSPWCLVQPGRAALGELPPSEAEEATASSCSGERPKYNYFCSYNKEESYGGSKTGINSKTDYVAVPGAPARLESGSCGLTNCPPSRSGEAPLPGYRPRCGRGTAAVLAAWLGCRAGHRLPAPCILPCPRCTHSTHPPGEGEATGEANQPAGEQEEEAQGRDETSLSPAMATASPCAQHGHCWARGWEQAPLGQCPWHGVWEPPGSTEQDKAVLLGKLTPWPCPEPPQYPSGHAGALLGARPLPCPPSACSAPSTGQASPAPGAPRPTRQSGGSAGSRLCRWAGGGGGGKSQQPPPALPSAPACSAAPEDAQRG